MFAHIRVHESLHFLIGPLPASRDNNNNTMSVLSRKDYFINLRKSYHVHVLSASETHIFLDNSANKSDDCIDNLIQLKCLMQVDLTRIDSLLTKLEDKLEQYKFGMPTLLISGEQEIYRQSKEEIETLCLKIKGQLESSFRKQPSEHSDEQLKSNLGAHLANRLTEQFEKFQVFQKMFHSILFERVKSTNSGANRGSDALQPDDSYSQADLQCQLVLDEGQEAMLKERTQEIDQVITDTLHVHDVLNQIQVMTVQQGSLFDRIDVNLDHTRRNLGKTIVRLEKTAESFSLHQKRLILFFITLAIFVVSLLILWK